MNIKSNFTLSTRLPEEEIKKRLSEVCDPSLSLSSVPFGVKRQSGKPFGGQVSADGFEIFKVIYQTNFHTPVLSGKFDHYLGRTEINVSVQPPKRTLILFGVAVGIVLIPGLFIPYLDAPFLFKVMGLVWLLIAFVGILNKFRRESIASEVYLAKVLEAQRVDG